MAEAEASSATRTRECGLDLYPWVHGAWRSLVAHLLWEQGVAGSNPAAPIKLSVKAVGGAFGLDLILDGRERARDTA
jgi:hypothetical protein